MLKSRFSRTQGPISEQDVTLGESEVKGQPSKRRSSTIRTHSKGYCQLTFFT